MDKIIRASNLQKALEDYDSLKGQPVLFVYTLPESPNIRTRVYCKQDVTTVTELFDLKIEGLVEEFADEYATGQYVIKNGYTVKYHNTNVGSVEISQGTVTLYEDQFTTALTDSFNLTDKYTFDVTLTVTEMAYYIGDGTNQILYPVVTFGVIEEVKSKIEKVYNTLDNKIDELADNFATDNLVVNNAVIDNAQVNNFDVSTLIANGSSGTDGQYLGKNNGNIEWVTPPFDTNHLYVNHLTVNENASIDNLGVNNVNVNGDNFTHKSFDVTSMTVISEDDYNNLDWNFRNQAFYLTSPNGNMYFHGIMYAPTYVPKKYTAYVNLPNMAKGNATLTTSILTFTSGVVTNNFVNAGSYNGIYEKTPIQGWHGVSTAPIGTQANDGNVVTNAGWLYVKDASNMYLDCTNLTDTFILNEGLIINKPEDYHTYVENMSGMLSGCHNFNQPITIPNGVTDISGLLSNTGSMALRGGYIDRVKQQGVVSLGIGFNQPITIPNSVTNMVGAFGGTIYRVEDNNNFYSAVSTSKFNQLITIPNSVTNMASAFALTGNFNQPITIPDSVTDISYIFIGSYVDLFIIDPYGNEIIIEKANGFNQPITIPNSVTNMAYAFSDFYFELLDGSEVMAVSAFNQPITIPNSVTNMAHAFGGSFNQPITIPNSVTNMAHAFGGSFNQPITIPNSVTDISGIFDNCYNFNQPITIPNSVTNMSFAFHNCHNFNQPITIPNSVTDISGIFDNCYNFNQPITIPNSVTDMSFAFYKCYNFNQPSITIPNSVTRIAYAFDDSAFSNTSGKVVHISRDIAIGNTSNYIYNMLVNGKAGLNSSNFTILNDA